jgi:hypothetical protein
LIGIEQFVGPEGRICTGGPEGENANLDTSLLEVAGAEEFAAGAVDFNDFPFFGGIRPIADGPGEDPGVEAPDSGVLIFV